jgi:hypothetical protein
MPQPATLPRAKEVIKIIRIMTFSFHLLYAYQLPSLLSSNYLVYGSFCSTVYTALNGYGKEMKVTSAFSVHTVYD